MRNTSGSGPHRAGQTPLLRSGAFRNPRKWHPSAVTATRAGAALLVAVATPRRRGVRRGWDARAGESREAGGGRAVAGGRGSAARGGLRGRPIDPRLPRGALLRAGGGGVHVAAALAEKGKTEPPLGPKLRRLAGHRRPRARRSRAARQRLDRRAAGDRAPPRGGREGEREARRGARVKPQERPRGRARDPLGDRRLRRHRRHRLQHAGRARSSASSCCGSS